MLQVFRVLVVVITGCAAAQCADDALVVPLTVCEVVADLPANDGKVIAVIGRYSFRAIGRWMGEQTCPSSGPASNAPAPTPELWMVEDPKDAPKPPEHLNLDSAALKSKFAIVQRRSTLVNFRFGTSDYDRWAVVYGRVERRTPDATHKAPANLVFRGSSVIIVITPGEW
ncbi:MAG: hypothetical protein WBY44_15120 [Bryobacteraceae bacterium]